MSSSSMHSVTLNSQLFCKFSLLLAMKELEIESKFELQLQCKKSALGWVSVLPKLTVVSSVGFSGIKELHWTWTCRSIHFWLSPGWDASPSQGYPQHINLLVPIYMYTPLWVEKGTVIARTQCSDWQRLNLLNPESSPLTFWHKTPCLIILFT